MNLYEKRSSAIGYRLSIDARKTFIAICVSILLFIASAHGCQLDSPIPHARRIVAHVNPRTFTYNYRTHMSLSGRDVIIPIDERSNRGCLSVRRLRFGDMITPSLRRLLESSPLADIDDVYVRTRGLYAGDSLHGFYRSGRGYVSSRAMNSTMICRLVHELAVVDNVEFVGIRHAFRTHTIASMTDNGLMKRFDTRMGAKIQGEGAIVAILDTGVYLDSCAFSGRGGELPSIEIQGDEPLHIPDTGHEKIRARLVVCTLPENEGCSPSGWEHDSLMHGTMTAAALGGGTCPSGWEGHSPGVRLVIVDLSSATGPEGALVMPSNWTALFETLVAMNVGYVSAAWGSIDAGYDAVAADFDAAALRYDNLIFVSAAGNGGASSFVTSPAIGLSVISVGSSPLSGSAYANAAEHRGMVMTEETTSLLNRWTALGFSSRGSRDGRQLPTMYAPGLRVESAIPGAFDAQHPMDGTSLSCVSSDVFAIRAELGGTRDATRVAIAMAARPMTQSAHLVDNTTRLVPAEDGLTGLGYVPNMVNLLASSTVGTTTVKSGDVFFRVAAVDGGLIRFVVAWSARPGHPLSFVSNPDPVFIYASFIPGAGVRFDIYGVMHTQDIGVSDTLKRIEIQPATRGVLYLSIYNAGYMPVRVTWAISRVDDSSSGSLRRREEPRISVQPGRIDGCDPLSHPPLCPLRNGMGVRECGMDGVLTERCLPVECDAGFAPNALECNELSDTPASMCHDGTSWDGSTCRCYGGISGPNGEAAPCYTHPETGMIQYRVLALLPPTGSPTMTSQEISCEANAKQFNDAFISFVTIGGFIYIWALLFVWYGGDYERYDDKGELHIGKNGHYRGFYWAVLALGFSCGMAMGIPAGICSYSNVRMGVVVGGTAPALVLGFRDSEALSVVDVGFSAMVAVLSFMAVIMAPSLTGWICLATFFVILIVLFEDIAYALLGIFIAIVLFIALIGSTWNNDSTLVQGWSVALVVLAFISAIFAAVYHTWLATLEPISWLRSHLFRLLPPNSRRRRTPT